MSDGKIVFTLKAGRDFDAPWVVISGDTVAEAVTHLQAVNGNEQAIVDQARLLQAAYSAGPLTTPTAAAPAAAPAAPAAPAATAPPASQPAGQMCVHGPRTYRTGTSARGAWQAYFCPLAKGHPDQCDAVFL